MPCHLHGHEHGSQLQVWRRASKQHQLWEGFCPSTAWSQGPVAGVNVPVLSLIPTQAPANPLPAPEAFPTVPGQTLLGPAVLCYRHF